MVINNIIRDEACNSCDVHHNLAKVSNLLPLLSVDDSLNFLIQLCNELSNHEKHNIWSIIQCSVCKYYQGELCESKDSLAQHKLHRILQWFRSDELSGPQRVTFVLKSLNYIGIKTLTLLRDFLSDFCDYKNEEDFEPDATHCPWSGQWVSFSEKTGGVDFISRLPVSVSKLILAYVGVNNVWCARLVSARWYCLVKDFVTEQRQFQSHVFRCRALRPALRNVNHTFANKVALCFTSGASTTGHPYVSEEQPGAIKVILEERNVYCGSYHVHNLHKHTDPHRKIHYCRGKYFATGSSDRKVRIRSLETGKLHKTIVGHAGSIRSLIIIESLKIVISGSYDLTIRAWSIETGAYIRLWRGHRGTITCLDHNDEWLISGARDSMVKVWYLKKSVIKRTFHHDRAILAVKLFGDRAAVGIEGQKLYLWDVSNGHKLKVFSTIGKVNCVNLTPHYIMGGADSVAYIWSMLSLYTDPLFTLPHPSQVLSVQYCYVRCVTGCGDGKIRVWSLVSGECIKVMRGNAQGDPITNVFVDVDRLLINTVSCINSLNFLPVAWDFCSEKFNKNGQEVKPVEKQDVASVSKRRCRSAVALRNHVRDTIDKQISCEEVEATPPATQTPSQTPSHLNGAIETCEPVDISTSPEGTMQTTVTKAAKQQNLFSDQFLRDTREVNTAELTRNSAKMNFTEDSILKQLKSVRSNRPSSAPFASKSLSLHGHLPSFVNRRPQTANVINQRVNVERVEKWQSSWQKLLSEIPESTENLKQEDDTKETNEQPSKQPSKQTKSPINKHPKQYQKRAPAWGADNSNSNNRSELKKSSVYRPKTATARIRY